VKGILERTLLPSQTYHLAGLPVAEDTFSHEMFIQIAVVAPLAFRGILLLEFRWLSLGVLSMVPLSLAILFSHGLVGWVGLSFRPALAYPPAVGILGQARDCPVCHVDNGPWRDEARTIIDILDADMGQSLRQKDGTFLIAVRRAQKKTAFLSRWGERTARR